MPAHADFDFNAPLTPKPTSEPLPAAELTDEREIRTAGETCQAPIPSSPESLDIEMPDADYPSTDNVLGNSIPAAPLFDDPMNYYESDVNDVEMVDVVYEHTEESGPIIDSKSPTPSPTPEKQPAPSPHPEPLKNQQVVAQSADPVPNKQQAAVPHGEPLNDQEVITDHYYEDLNVAGSAIQGNSFEPSVMKNGMVMLLNGSTVKSVTVETDRVQICF
ncbi:hypothetical protein F5B20DRAFT_585946 [Whalleya microplaca]|nr:hypothetical protein F5B20DRAFT_585946 [Whalleya microplaca]